MKKALSTIAVVCASSLFAGCATPEKALPELSSLEKSEMKLTLDLLNESTVMAVNAQRELALSADARVRRESNFRKRFLTDKVDYNFYGDASQILSDVANTYDYSFKEYGNKPIGGVLVNVLVKNMSGVDLIKAIAYADPGQRIDVRLTDSEIIIYYKETSNTSIKRLSR